MVELGGDPPSSLGPAALLATAGLACTGWVVLSSPGLQQDDWLHLALAQMASIATPIVDFSWAPHTLLADRYADLHHGFHVMLKPWVTLADPMIGGKLMGLCCLALLVAAITFAAPKGPNRMLASCLCLLASAPFLTRAVAIRPIALSAIALVLALQWLEARRTLRLGLLGAVFAVSYAAFPLLAIPVAVHVIAEAVLERRLSWRGPAALVVGIAAGLLLHPYRANLPTMLWVQWFGLGSGGEVDLMNTEWAAPGLAGLLRGGGFLWPLLVVATVASIRAASKGVPRRTLVWAGATALSLTLFATYNRGVDYFVPFAVVFVTHGFSHIHKAPRRWMAAPGLAVVAMCGWVNLTALHATYATRAKLDASAAATWLQGNSQAGSEVFLVDYGSFPQLFFRNRHNVYSVAFDPSFIRHKDAELYKSYADAVHLRRDPYPVIRDGFAADYVYVENTSNGRHFYEYMQHRPEQFERTHQDNVAAVFRVR